MKKDDSFPVDHQTSTEWMVAPHDHSRRRLVTIIWILLWAGLVLANLASLGYIFWPESQAFLAAPTAAGPAVLLSPPPPALPPPLPVTEAAGPASPSRVFLPTPPVTGEIGIRPDLPVPPAGGGIVTLTPAAAAAGWASSLDGQAHFNDPNLHAGHFRDQVYHGAIQFDLSLIPPGARITYAALVVVGLSDQNLHEGGGWQVQLLEPAVDITWTALDYQQLHEAPVKIRILPGLTPASLGRERVNIFPFGPEQLIALQERLTPEGSGRVSFRLDGPLSGGDNLFTWDSGYNSEIGLRDKEAERQAQGVVLSEEERQAEWLKLNRKPVLWLETTAVQYVAVTATPTPENIFTAAAVAATATQSARTIGTATPLPAAWATPIVVTPRPAPANAATATHEAAVVTAEAIAFGTATPTPLNVWTATPTPERIFVTSTPTPGNVVTRAALASMATYAAQTTGTYTPVPSNWVTPFVVTPMPTPVSAATATFYDQVATAEAFLYGMVWTATPTALFFQPTAVPTMTPTPGYIAVPAGMVGKIAFLSDRAGDPKASGQKEVPVYVMDPDGTNVTVLTDRAAYDSALARDGFSADLRFEAYVDNFLRFDGRRIPGIYFRDYYYNTAGQLTKFGSGLAWDPAWSPTAEQITFVSNEMDNDDIWVINRDGSGLFQLTNDANWDKHPSWSPDGSQIIFWSNRTGNAQIWVMNAAGTGQHIIAPNSFNDWNPVWVKYADVPPGLPQPTPTRKPVFIEYD